MLATRGGNLKTPSQTLSQSLRRSSRVVIAAQIASQLVSLGVLAALYRLLGLGPYGLLGMVVPLLLLVRTLISSGLNVAAIQEAELSDQQLSALFWVNQALGVATALLTAGCAPVLVWFYGAGGHDVAGLGWLTVALAGTSVLTALSVEHEALLQRKLRLGTVAVVRAVALGAGGLGGIAAAVAGWGVWALVVQQYAELFTLAAILWSLEPWRPGWHLRGVGARRLVGFGGYCMLSALMFYVVANVDKVLVGFFLGPNPLALYSQAFNLAMKPVSLVLAPLAGVMLPVLSRAKADRRQYGELTLGFFRFIGLVMLPAAVGLAIVAPEAIRVLGGPEWADAGPILRVLALALLVQGFMGAIASVFASAGRADRLAYASVIIALVLCAAFLVGLHLGRLTGDPAWAALGVAVSYSLTMVLVVFPPYLRFALRTVGVRCADWLAQLRTAGLAALAMGLVVLACRWVLEYSLQTPDAVLLAVEVLVGVLTYAVFARRQIAWFVRQGVKEASGTVV
jgi:O-antigen/teichoic acid export membrane protein